MHDRLYVGYEFVVGGKHAARFDYESYVGKKAVVININHPNSTDFAMARIGRQKFPIRKEDIPVEDNQ